MNRAALVARVIFGFLAFVLAVLSIFYALGYIGEEPGMGRIMLGMLFTLAMMGIACLCWDPVYRHLASKEEF